MKKTNEVRTGRCGTGASRIEKHGQVTLEGGPRGPVTQNVGSCV